MKFITRIALLIGIPSWAVILGGIIALIGVISATIAIHDHNVRKADRARQSQLAQERSDKAAIAADKAQEKRNDAIKRTLDDVGDAASDDEWIERMRKRQNADHPATP